MPRLNNALEALAHAVERSTAAIARATGPLQARVRRYWRLFRLWTLGGWRAVRAVEPEFFRNLQAELSSGQQWIDRAIVLVYAAITGIIVVCFTFMAEAAHHRYVELLRSGWTGALMAVIWTPLVAAGVLWWMRRFAPGAAGSGIPQVMRAIDDSMTESQRHWLASWKLSFHKIGMVTAGLGAGLSIGREGPTVQVGAGIMDHARRWLSPRTTIDSHDLMVAGAAAGIAAAFNTPLGGIVFALEKLTRRRSLTNSSLTITAIVLSGLIAVAVFGNETYFGKLKVQEMGLSLWWPGLLIALATGLAGGLLARLLVLSARGMNDRFSVWRRQYPYRFAAGCGLAVAIIGVVTGGATAGAGYAATRALLEGQAELPGVYTLLKFCATWLSSWSGVPAGVFAPSLAIGAGIGHDVAMLLGFTKEAAIPLIALGMVGFLAAATGGPITAFIIVMEMVSGHQMVLSLMACSLLANGVSRLITPPLYYELAALLPIPGLMPSPAPQPVAEPPAQPADDAAGTAAAAAREDSASPARRDPS